MDNCLSVKRREFLFGSAGITFSFLLPSNATAKSAANSAPTATSSTTVGAWVKIEPNNRITIVSPASELGQGSMTSLPMIFAEYMDVNWDNVEIEFSPADDELFQNPIWWAWGIMLTLGSSSITGYHDRVRKYGAQTRKLLMMAAAAKWGVNLSGVITEPSVVVHKASGRQLSYGDIAAFMKKPLQMPEVSDSELKKRSDFRFIGSDIPRYDIPEKVAGKPIFSIDANPPGMLYATVKRSPVLGGKPMEIVNEREISRQKNILKVITLDDAVAIIAKTYEAAYKADGQLNVRWSSVEKLASYDQRKGLENHAQAARDINLKGIPWQSEGDVTTEFENADKVYQAEYSTEYLYHAQLEPLNSVAHLKGEKLEVWAGTQAPTHLLRTIKSELGIAAEDVTLHRSFMGGAFGRRAAQDHDYVIDSIILSKAMAKPVKVIWRREEEFHAARLKPISYQYLRAAEDEQGKLVAWSHRTVSEEAHKTADPYRFKKNKGFPIISGYGIDTAYDFGNNILCEVVDRNVGVRISAMRGIGTILNKFASESFIDEIAASKGIDAVQMRLELLHRDIDAQKVVKTAAEMSNWDNRTKGHGLGIAFANCDGTKIAMVSRVECDKRTGVITVPEVWAAIDIGLAVHPKNAEGQVEGGIIFALSNILKERITFSRGAIDQTNFHEYNLMRIDEIPTMEIKLIEREGANPTGIGDSAAVVLGAAVGNGLASLTGKRIRKLPFTSDHVLEVL